MESADVRSGATAEDGRGKHPVKTRPFRISGNQDDESVEGPDQDKALVKPKRGVKAAGGGGIFPTNASEFVMALGFGLFFSSLQVLFGNNLLLAHRLPIGFTVGGAVSIAGFLAFCVTVVVCWYYSDRIALLKSRRVCTVVSAILAALALLRYAAERFDVIIWPLAILVEVACGIAFAVMLIMWVADMWVLNRRAAVRVMILSMCIAAGCAAFVANVSASMYRYLAIAVCLALSGLSYLAASHHVEAEEFLSRDETRRNIKFDMRTSASLFITATAYGFCLSVIAEFGEIGFTIVAASILLAAILAAVSMVFLGDHGVLLGTIFRWMCPVLTAGFVVMPFASGFVLHACATLVLAVCVVCLMSLLVTLVQVKIRFKVQPVYACARVLVPCAWGALLGLVAAIVEYELAGVIGSAALVVLSMLIVVLLSVSAAVAPYGIDMLTMPIEPDSEAEEPEDEERDLHAWKTACDKIAKEYGLTPREIDVFMLLAKGRNAKVIERELFISVYTIKGHNNNIYRKLGVKSQQELIDMVESYRREIWKPKSDGNQGGGHG